MKKSKKNAMEEFEAANAKSEKFVKKITSIAKQNKARTSKSKINEHKFEYIKQALNYNNEMYFFQGKLK